MTPLPHPRLESFCQGLAKGMTAKEAAVAAGYTHFKGNTNKRAKTAAVVARVEALLQHAKAGGSRDLSGVIDELMALARTAGELKSAAGMMSAKSLLSEAARLKLLMPEPPSPEAGRGGAAGRLRRPPELTKTEWLAAFAPNHAAERGPLDAPNAA